MITIGFSTRSHNQEYIDYLQKTSMYKDVEVIEKINNGEKSLSQVYNEILAESVNDLVVLCNVFGPEVATRLLFYKMAKDDYPALKTYLMFLSVMPDRVRGIKGQDIISSDIPVDMKIADMLRDIK